MQRYRNAATKGAWLSSAAACREARLMLDFPRLSDSRALRPATAALRQIAHGAKPESGPPLSDGRNLPPSFPTMLELFLDLRRRMRRC